MVLDVSFMKETFGTLWTGVPVTLSLTFLSLVLAAPAAFYAAVLRLHGARWGAGAVRWYVSFVRGTPIILQILLLFNIFEAVDPFWYAVVVFTLNTIALLSEVFRSALLAIPSGQREAGLSIGLTEVQTYVHIIIPQALTVALPAICNITVNLVKGTSLAFLMTVKDVMAVGKVAAAYGYNYVEAYLDVFVLYLILCTVIQIGYSLLEHRFGRFRQQAA